MCYVEACSKTVRKMFLFLFFRSGKNIFFKLLIFGGSTRERNYMPREITDQAHTTGTVIPVEIEKTTTKDSL